MDKLREREAGSTETQRPNFNQRHNAIPLKSVQPGTPVHIKDMGTTSTVTGAAKTAKSYLDKTEDGTVRRNRSQVNPIPNNTNVTGVWKSRKPESGIGTGMGTRTGTGTGTGDGDGDGTGTVM